ncbi:MAG TPA: hybrid sensor histidine kinase/response regulator [Rubricoccaceae bacterium]|nr:hybrid sensor histidine kinase/response regulator [Rubricoccaceae bacterium]
METILIIEDEPDIRDNVVDLLEAEGYRVLAAEHGGIGLALARAHSPDLILCDVMMPEVDGFGVLQELQAEPALAEIPFVFLTALAERGDHRRGMAAGADDYLAKPFTANELIATVEGRLGRALALKSRSEERVERVGAQLSAMIPHELRTPLSVVIGYARILREEWGALPEADALAMLDAVQVAAEDLHGVVERYQLWASLRLREAAADPAAVTAVAPVAEHFARATAARHGRLRDLRLDLAPVEVAVARAHLERVVTELVDNACKYSPAGTLIEVGCRPLGEHAVLAVSDGGPGLTPDQLRRLGALKPGGRGESGEAYAQSGSGLGLALATALAELNGGALTLGRRSDGRTTAQVVLPAAGRARPEPPGDGAHAAAVPHAAASPRPPAPAVPSPR